MFRKLVIGAALASLLVVPAAAQSVDAIIAKNLDAMGGVSKLRAINSMKFTGNVVAGGGMVEGTIALFQTRPNNIRVNLEFMGAQITQAYDGQDAWIVQPEMMGGSGAPEDMPKQQAESFIENADPDGPLLDYKKKGHKVELVGKEDMEGTSVYHLKVTFSESGNVTHMYLDAENHVVLKTVSNTFNPQSGTKVESETILGDYKPVDGVLVPYSMEQWVQGNQAFTMTLETVEFNVAVDEGIFKRPQS